MPNEPSINCVLNLYSGDYFIVFSGLASLIAVYSLVLFVKNRYATTPSTNSSENQLETRLCIHCKENQLNQCKILYNKLFANGKGHLPASNCFRCGIKLDCNGTAQSKKYGKVDGENAAVELSVDDDSIIRSAGQSNGLREETAEKVDALFDRKEGTGVGFDPDTVSIIESEARFCRASTLDNMSSFQTVLEVDEAIEADEDFMDTNGPDVGASADSQRRNQIKFKWSSSVKKVWQTQKVVELLKHAGDRVKQGKESFIQAGRQMIIDHREHSSNSKQRQPTEEEPEFLNSKKLRSAEIQM